eukprot:TRINITY_DN77667_c0_g1_i1.p1 TRINITY_DN77667_c0_g1~~TRINITY_DN77667_c0_g1_i1.p1  ORF type:complete len:370 (+),score=40.33 TRINITY_DN77667_c0_g1_i1:70-1179(+)
MPALSHITQPHEVMSLVASFCGHFALSTLRCAAESFGVAARQHLVCCLVNYIERKAARSREDVCNLVEQSGLRGLPESDMSYARRAHLVAMLCSLDEERGRQLLDAERSCELLEQEVHRARIATAAALRAIAKDTDDLATTFMMRKLDHRSFHVRALCVAGLLGLVKGGHTRILVAVKARLDDKHPVVRCQVLEALAFDADAGKAARIEAVVSRLEKETNSQVIVQATHALQAIASREQFLHIIARLTRHPQACIRQAAVNTLRTNPHEGNEYAILALVERLEDEYGTIRWDAVDALKRHTDRGDKRAIGAATSVLRHPQSVVRRAALELIKALVVEGDEQTLASITRCTEDDAVHIRQMAIDLLRKLT